MTKRQLSRHQRDLRLQRLTKIGFGALVATLLLIVGFGYWNEELAPAGQAIVTVRGTSVPTQTYAKLLGYRQYMIDAQIARMQAFAAQQGGASSGEGNADIMQQLVQQQVQQLQQQRAGLESTLVDELIDNELIRQEAAKRGITVSPSDIDAEIYNQVVPPTPAATPTVDTGASAAASGTTSQTPGATPQAEATPPAATTPAPTATPVTQEQAMAQVRQLLGEIGVLSEQEHRDLVIAPTILREKLEGQLKDAVLRDAEQVWARHILVDQQDEARDILKQLQDGGDFAALAKEHSKDTSNRDKAGDLGWFTRGQMVPEFDAAAYSLQAGETVSEPVKTTYGYHVIQALGHEQKRPLSEDQLDSAKAEALGNWLRAQRTDDPNAVAYGYSWEQLAWARNWVAKNAKYLRQAPRPVGAPPR